MCVFVADGSFTAISNDIFPAVLAATATANTDDDKQDTDVSEPADCADSEAVTKTQSPSPTSLTSDISHDCWTNDETKFLISAMSRHLADNDGSMPTSLAELEKKIKYGRGKKKALWAELADQLESHFGMQFDCKHVARKWQTLLDGYKKALSNNNSTGKERSKFVWFDLMNDLVGSRHDMQFVVTGTQVGVTVHRSEELKPETSVGADTGERKGKQKRKAGEPSIGDVLKYMKEADES